MRGAETPYSVKSDDYFCISVLGIAVLKRVLNSLCVYVVPIIQYSEKDLFSCVDNLAHC